MESIPEHAVAASSFPIMSGDNSITAGAWDAPAMVQLEDFFRLGYNGPMIRMVDSQVCSALEFPREMVWQTIRSFFGSFDIKVYVFRDQVEIRGLIPTEVLDVPGDTERDRKESIISLARGRGQRG